MRPFKKRKRLVLTSYAFIAAWGLFVLWFALLLLVEAGLNVDFQYVKFVLYVDLLIGFVGIVLSWTLRCETCNRLLLVETEEDLLSNKFFGISKWGKAVTNIVRTKEFHCVHCKEKYSV